MTVVWPARLALPVLMLLIAGPAGAQEEERRGFLGLGIGPSAPFGAFADASPDNPRAGRATPGYTDTMINIGYRFGRRVGVAGAFSYSEYSMRDDEGDDWWQVAGLMIGPMVSYPLGARAAVDLKAMFGLLALTPVVDGYTTADGTGSGLGLDLRAAARYDVFRRWAVFAEAGTQSAAVSFSTGLRTDHRAIISGFGIAFRPMW